jgi:phosphopentomutase
MPRVFLLVLDSVGIGGAPDAARYGDGGANTLGHIAEACACGEADLPGRRCGRLRLPNLARLGLGEAARLATGKVPDGLTCPDGPAARVAAASEVSAGKDTPSGHWEIAGLPVRFAWGMFPRTEPCFPASLIDDLCAQAGLPGVLGNKHASGTAIIDELGAEHMRSGRPICYTSADSVLQIAAHEETFGLDRLLAICAVARKLVDPLNIGRVIARPFSGSPASGFRRTANRRDFSVPPFGPTLLDLATTAGREVVTIGKIGDIFAHTATGQEIKADGNDAVVNASLEAMARVSDGGFVFANLVDFDSLYGHRRDVGGYAEALETFDQRVPDLLGALRPGDLLVITADHGCDPTWTGTDHTREQVPVLAFEPGRAGGSIGQRHTFADIAATAARHLGLPAPQAGTPF